MMGRRYLLDGCGGWLSTVIKMLSNGGGGQPRRGPLEVLAGYAVGEGKVVGGHSSILD